MDDPCVAIVTGARKWLDQNPKLSGTFRRISGTPQVFVEPNYIEFIL